jgi:hypothetical protein
MDYQVLALDESEFQDVRSGNDLTDRRRRWWCYENPLGGMFAVARFGDELAGTCYLGGKTLIIDGNETRAFEIGESSTEPAHQRKGVFSKVASLTTEYGYSQGAEIVYGTPNSQAMPGWRKLKFDIVTSSASWLFLIPNPFYFIKTSIAPIAKLVSRADVTELSGEDYVEKTKNFSRLNKSSRDYLLWRLAKAPWSYRFFKTVRKNSEILCCFRYGQLGRFPILVCSEFFLDGRRAPLSAARPQIARMAFQNYDARTFAGVHFHSQRQPALAGFVQMLLGAAPHRPLPICIKSRIPYQTNLFADFQLSDCDIG